ncbi:MAG: twin transmembrane helix small protein [Granulosicoccus sp.]
MLLVKLIVLLLLGFVIISLFSGLYFLVKDKGQTNRTVNALSVRIGLSIVAIVVVMIAGATGVIELNPSPLSAQGSQPVTTDTLPDGEPEQSGGGRRPITDGS